MFKVAIVSSLALLAAPALAADLIIPDNLQPIYGDAGFDWSGGYVGASIGGQSVRIFAPGQGTIEGGSLLGGVYAGFNGQSGNLVFGAEADLEYSGFNQTKACPNPAWSCNGYVNGQGSVRGRIGYAIDTLLIYGTAGVAVANVGGSTTNPANVVFSDSAVRLGYTVGAGAEVAFNDNLVGRVEYRYTSLIARDMNFDVRYSGVEVSSHAVRAGMAYKF